MKVAIIKTQSITVVCPECGMEADSPYSASKFWPVEDNLQAGQEYYCSECGEEFKLPTRVPSLNLKPY